MTRTFLHDFDPYPDSPVAGPRVEFTVQQIEDAGLREVLQTPGAAFGSWTILEALLEPTAGGTPFVFRRPLGEAREVKVALSGLFGRFVARAYLERYIGLSIFTHLGNSTVVLDGGRHIEIVRRTRGDLPDWIACDDTHPDLTVAEAKGSHDPSGPERALDRAWKQAHRIDVKVDGHPVTLKRMAIVTRWGMSTGGPPEPRISVRDPIDERHPIGPDDEGAIFAGLFRHHVANLLTPLGHAALAASLRHLASADSDSDEWRRHEIERVDDLLNGAEDIPVEGLHVTNGLIGGIVTRARPLNRTRISRSDQIALARLDLRPVFVGIERELVQAAAYGDPSRIRRALTDVPVVERGARRGNRASGWIIPLEV